MFNNNQQVLFYRDSNGTLTCPTNSNEFIGVGVGVEGEGILCSGHGECIEGVCVCEWGWSGLSDYYDLYGIDCHSPKSI